ncbi:hypothetical protein NKG05_26220 [Oerskovia sp. M15]
MTDGGGRHDDLTLLAVPGEPEGRERLVERLHLLRSVDHEHLARVDDLVEGDAEHLAVLTRRPPGTDLDLLMACRGPLLAARRSPSSSRSPRRWRRYTMPGSRTGRSTGRTSWSGRRGVRCSVRPRSVRHRSRRGRPCARRARHGLVRRRRPCIRADATSSGRRRTRRWPPCTRSWPWPSGPIPADGPRPGPSLRSATRPRPHPVRHAGAGAPGGRSHRRPLGPGGSGGDHLAAARRVPARPSAARHEPDDDTVVRAPLAGTTRAQSQARARRAAPRSGGVVRPWAAPRHGAGERHGAAHRTSAPALVAALVLVVCAGLAGGVLVLRSWPRALRPPGGPRPQGRRSSPTNPRTPPWSTTIPSPPRSSSRCAGSSCSPATGSRPRSCSRVTGGRGRRGAARRGRGRGCRHRGARAEVQGARALGPDGKTVDPPPGGDEAGVEVTYSVSAHTQRAADGSATEVPPNGPVVALLTLRWTDVGWRVSEVG